MSDYAFGVYLIQQWADVAGTDKQAAVIGFKAAYGEDAIKGLGSVFNSQHLNVTAARAEMRKLLDNGSSPEHPTLADLNSVILNVAGTPPSWGTVVSDAVKETGSQLAAGASIAFTGLKWVTVLAGIGLAVYVGFQSGFFRGLAKNSK